jgi:BirA family biotin operon repressor/biotin-[acetyl-CoA-carboxylase] ligase
VSALQGAGLSPDRVGRLLRVATWRLVGGGATGSTSDDAKALARAGDPGGVVVLATSQTAGRARFDRGWDSPDGGVYASVFLRLDTAPDRAGALPLAAGLGIARGLGRLGAGPAGPIRLKWPNDLRVADSKLCGVLVESSVSAGRLEWIVVGFGINVVRPAGGAGPAGPSAADPGLHVAHLSDVLDIGVDLAAVAAAALDGLADSLAAFERCGFGPLLEEYTRLSDLVGERVTVRGAAGAVVAEGVVTGFDADGRLLLSGDRGSASVSAGEVTLRD